MGSTLKLNHLLMGLAMATVVASSSPLVHAESGRPPNAQRAFDRAVELAKEGKTCEAARAFSESYDLFRARDTLNGLALSEEECGKSAKAHRHFTELARQARSAADSRRAEIADEGLARLAPKVGRLAIDAPAGTSVVVDGERIPESALTSAWAVEGGRHSVVATRREQTFERELSIAPGSAAKVTVEFDDNGRSAELGALGVIGIAVAGLGVVGVVSGAALYASAGSTFNSVQQQCPANQCPSALANDIAAGEREEVAGQVLIGVGVALTLAGATAVTWSLLDSDADDVALGVLLRPGSVALDVRF